MRAKLVTTVKDTATLRLPVILSKPFLWEGWREEGDPNIAQLQ
jgi:hypothetical protein